MASEFEELFDEWLSQVVSVQTRTGDSAKGAVYAAPESVEDILIEEGAKLVTDTTGNSAQANTTLYVPLDKMDRFTPESRVTISGRVARVITVSKFVVVGLPGSGVVYCA